VRNQILEAAAQLFAQSGYDGVSMRDIAKVVGVTQANLYYHFRDKAELIEATLAYVFESRAESLDAALAARDEDPLGTFVHWFVQALTNDQVFARLLYRELWDGEQPRIDALSRTVLQKPFRSVVNAVAEGGTQSSAKAIAFSLVGFILGQALLRPAAPGLIGNSVSAKSVEQTARRLVSLMQQSSAES
jgi:AcrR family transcriptional regulator